jgi:hypothetical protein
MSASSLRVIIVGAGTGGLCLAQGLKRAGIDVAVYERDRTRRDGLQGYRVGIDPDGSRALHACLPPELFETFVATCARPPRYFSMLTEQLAEVLCLEERRPTDPIDSEKPVSRMTLRQVLLTGVEDVVSFDRAFTHYEHRPDGRVTAFFEDGSSATGDVLVAADGSNSRVRRQYLPHTALVDSGLLGITAKVPLTEGTERLLPDKVFHGVSMVFAPKGYSCILHVMEFPWDTDGRVKDGIGGSDADLLETWPGLLYDNTRDYIMWGFAAAGLTRGVSHWTGAAIDAFAVFTAGMIAGPCVLAALVLFLPVGTTLEPPLRADRLKSSLAPDPETIVWLRAADGDGFRRERLRDELFLRRQSLRCLRRSFPCERR